MRQLARLARRSTPLPKPPPITVEGLREQLPGMSPEDRKRTQQLLSNEKALNKALQESESSSNISVKELIGNFMQNATSPSEFDATFWGSVRELIRETSGRNNIDARADNIPMFVNLFQIAKQQHEEPLRSRMLYLLGSYVYRLRMLRFDPVNEAEYLDALSKNSQPIQAVTLWKSRKDRPDVADSVYWYDIGVLYHLEAGLVRSAEALAREMLAKFDYVSPRCVCELIKVSKDSTVQSFWIEYLSAAKQYPETKDITEKQSVYPEQLEQVFEALVVSRNWAMAQLFLVKVPCFNLKFPLKRSKKPPQGNLNELASTAIEKYPSATLGDSAFFTFWITNHMREGRVQEALDILEVTRDRKIEFTEPQAAALLEQLHRHQCAGQAQQLASEYDLPQVAVVHLEYLAPDEVADYIESINCELTPPLAEKILETGGKISYPLLDICSSHGCWKLLWDMIRRKSHPNAPSPKDAVESMLRARTYSPTLNLIEAVLQALILDGESEYAVAVLLYMESKHNLHPNKLLLASIQAAENQKRDLPLGKLVKGDIPWPRQGPLAQSIPVETIAHTLRVDLANCQQLADSWT